MQTLKLKHLVAVRWFHWINFPLLFLMIWSGFLIYWAYDIYSIGPIHFFPKWMYANFHMDHRLSDGMALHFFAMWLFVVNGLLYVGYTWISGEWRYLVPRSFSVFRDAWHVVLYDLGLHRAVPEREKYNAAQQVTYSAIILMGAGSVLSGLAIYKPAQLSWLTALFGGYRGARFTHFYLTIGYLVFFVIHIAQVARAGWNNFRGMVIGYELVKDNE
ncbi:MAG: cytochrome b/b6 domain-containing protein [Acidobacteriota bacterium]|nr:cytochrome b/b6 domain-containing protein [Acidobacteriota bacterium]